VKCLHAHYGWWLAGGDDPVGAWVAKKLATDTAGYIITSQIQQSSQRPGKSMAAIDIGTNSTNLLIIDSDGNELAREVHITRLGEGVATTKQLSDAAMTRTMQRLENYRSLIDHHGVESLRVVATEACRQASNVATFLEGVHAIIGVTPELLSGSDEGRLTYRGALSGLAPSNESTVVIDIGGGSTEIMLGTTSVDHVVSIPIGAVVITERELHHDPPRPEELTNAIGLAADLIEDIIRQRPEVRGATRVIGVAGTIVTVAAVELGLHTFDAARLHGMSLPRSAVEDVFRTLATESLANRRHNPGLSEQRADIIVGGCCVLVAIMRKLHLNSITVSTRNILDGIAAELLSGVSS
jgi:exopolyphosphatase/guanosine-5'-triphosphate,3'-diphosphate pyrophosphatase